MNLFCLVFLLTENYLDRARPFLQSLKRISHPSYRQPDYPLVYCVCLGFEPSKALQDEFGHIDFLPMPRHPSESSPGIMQHGRWMDAWEANGLDIRDDDLLVLSDADIIIQRDFTETERRHLQSLDANTYAAGWNAHPGDNLAEEAARIGLTDDGTLGIEEWKNIPCWNTGVLAMRGIAWRRLRDLYESRCERFYKLTNNRARGQWLICWCLHRLGMKAEILGYETHLHGHFAPPPEAAANMRDGVLYSGDNLVMFRHAIG